MAIFKPFRAFRPTQAKAAQVASRPYDVLSSDEARAEIEENPLSFLRIIKSEAEFPASQNPYDEMVYQKARNNFLEFVNDGTLVQDEQNCFYFYKLVMGLHTQTGIVGVAGIDDYFDDVIKKHEFTRPAKEQDRITHMRTTGIHSGPVFTAYRQNDELDALVAQYCDSHKADINFVAEDDIRHTLWKVSEKDIVNQVEQLFKEKIEATYIADGHHRAASSAKVGKALRGEQTNYTGEESFNYFLSVLFPDNQLEIIDYNRLIKDLNGLSAKGFLNTLKENFEVTECRKAFKPQDNYQFGFYLDGQWFAAQLKQDLVPPPHPIQSLDISVLEKYMLKPILNIQDQRTDPRIDFVGGIRGLGELERRVDSGEMKMAISIFPVTMNQLFAVADSGEVMPPKTTWFEPKLRSGLVVHRFLE